MSDYEELTARLLAAYGAMEDLPDWAVRKRNDPARPVKPTIPFVGKAYGAQAKKILVYASAENLADYWKGNDRRWPGDWLDDDVRAVNRHRYCFDNGDMQHDGSLPYVHCSPMEKGGLLTAVMYLAWKLRGGEVEKPAAFYETIAFGNYGKFSIETQLQQAVRTHPLWTDGEKREYKKQFQGRNVDYAARPAYLRASFDYIRADLEVLQPDYIIMPNMADSGFIDSVKGTARIIRIRQMNGTVVNSMAPHRGNGYQSAYVPYDVDRLPPAIREAYGAIRGINLENYRYVFDYLDKTFSGLEMG